MEKQNSELDLWLRGLSKTAIYRVNWYVARMSIGQLRLLNKQVTTKMNDKIIKRTQKGLNKFKEFEAREHE